MPRLHSSDISHTTQADHRVVRRASKTGPTEATGQVEHEASTSKVSDDQLFYLRSRGISEEEAHHMIITGWTREVIKELPFEFAMEAGQLLKVSLEGAVG